MNSFMVFSRLTFSGCDSFEKRESVKTFRPTDFFPPSRFPFFEMLEIFSSCLNPETCRSNSVPFCFGRPVPTYLFCLIKGERSIIENSKLFLHSITSTMTPSVQKCLFRWPAQLSLSLSLSLTLSLAHTLSPPPYTQVSGLATSTLTLSLFISFSLSFSTLESWVEWAGLSPKKATAGDLLFHNLVSAFEMSKRKNTLTCFFSLSCFCEAEHRKV